jgi:two-component sensor histidine kinase
MKGAELAKMALPTAAAIDHFVQCIQGQMQSAARLHRLLSDHAERTAIELSQLLPSVCEPFASMYAGQIAVAEDFAFDCTVRPDQCLPISQIVAEAMTNVAKHARAEEGLRIIVRCRATDAGVWVEVIDNGRGLPDGFRPETSGGLGFRLMRLHAAALGGTITFKSTGDGLSVGITVPLD